ncbi:MAG TPA: sulfatase-like hydrolase/transferase [Anaerolineales bacterium]|nr:sulfatase-like hydrolase/transferase [Anaerolineales bacterium]
MKKNLLLILNAPWYFIPLAAYPVLALLTYNISQVRYTAGIRSLIISVFAAVLLFLLFRLIYKDWHRAAFATAAFTILFFTYGHVFDQIQMKWKIAYLPIWLGALWLVLLIVVLVWAGWRRTHFQGATLTMNFISLGLVIYSAVQVVSAIPTGKQSIKPVDPHAPLQTLQIPTGQTPPDIYYIILDSYGRTDLLAANLNYDNSEFISALQKMGFYVADCSQSNYPRTDVSLGSSLNMDYLQNLNDKFTPKNEDRSQLWQSILQSTVRYELENAGYKTVAFASGFAFTEVTTADVYLTPSLFWSAMTEFEILLVRTTPLRHLEDLGLVKLGQVDGQRYRDRTELDLDSMDMLAHMAGPKFVFIHMVIPHPLFVFAADGSPTDPSQFTDANGVYSQENYYKGYLNQVAFIDGQIEKAAQTLLSDSPNPPVIVIQGDHGPWLQSGSDQFKILNAYYLPGHNNVLYPGISPVNTFRMIFNTYLGGHYPILKDISYDSPVPYVFDLTQDSTPCSGK